MQTFLISGQYLSNTTAVIFNDRPVTQYRVLSDTFISGTVPSDAISGPILVRSFGGETAYPSVTLTYPPITVSRIIPTTGRENDIITVSGNNFYRIDKVLFNGLTGSFSTISSGVIQAKVPTGASSGIIKVASTDRNITGSSTTNFVVFPKITGFSPMVGLAGTQVQIGGSNFSGVHTILFNNISGSGVTIVNNNICRASVPTGNTHGYIQVKGALNVSTTSLSRFQPIATISSLTPNTGQESTFLTISGTNFIPSLLYGFSGVSGTYKVNFNGGITGFYIKDFYSLTGRVPKNAISGPLSFYANDGSMYSSTGNFRMVTPPIIYRSVSATSPAIYPNSFNSGSMMIFNIYGKNFFNLSGIKGTGTSGLNSGNSFFISGNRLTTDSLGKRITVTGFSTSGILTGFYRIYVSGWNGVAYSSGSDSGIRII